MLLSRDFLFIYRIPLVVALICLAAALGGELAQEALRYDRDAILHGQVWRLITGNFLHLSWTHLALNLAGLALVWLFFGQCFNTWQWVAIILFTALVTGLGLLALVPTVGWYVGLSGALHGYFTAGCVAEIRLKLREGWWMLALITVKLAWEQTHGAMPGTASLAGGEVIVDAHLYGAIAGLAAVLLKPAAPAHPASTTNT